MRPLLKYLMTTEAGGREEEADRAAEWDQIADREGEESVWSIVRWKVVGLLTGRR